MHTAQTIDPVKLKEVADSAALAAGSLVRRKWSEPRQISEKGYRDVVTDADFASQALITEMIRAEFPDHGFLTEEDDATLPESGPVIWVIDPIDGTTNYSRQVPTYCISIGAAIPQAPSDSDVKGYRPVAGAIYDPMRDELFSAAAGHASTLNGRQITASEIDDLGRAIVSMDWSRDYQRRQGLLTALSGFAHQAHTIRATGSASLALAWIAAGRFDVYFNFGIGPWDVAAAIVIITQAGGTVTNAAGLPWTLADANCVASNGLIHEDFLAQAGLGSNS